MMTDNTSWKSCCKFLIAGILYPFWILGALFFCVISWVREFFCGRRVVGIFSRSGESDYQWLTDRLRSRAFRGLVRDIKSVYIANDGFQEFTRQVESCHFAILYHTKNRGRVNITDVTDSLYDTELRHLSENLGRKNVIVVVDDLDDSAQTMRSSILSHQPSISQQAKQLFLFSKRDKTQLQLMDQKMQDIKNTMSQGLSLDLCECQDFFNGRRSQSSLQEPLLV